MDTLTNMAIKDVKGKNEAIFTINKSGLDRPIMEIAKAPIKRKVIGVALVLISSVRDTRAPTTPYTNK